MVGVAAAHAQVAGDLLADEEAEALRALPIGALLQRKRRRPALGRDNACDAAPAAPVHDMINNMLNTLHCKSFTHLNAAAPHCSAHNAADMLAYASCCKNRRCPRAQRPALRQHNARYAAMTVVPRAVQSPTTRSRTKRSVLHQLGSAYDVRMVAPTDGSCVTVKHQIYQAYAVMRWPSEHSHNQPALLRRAGWTTAWLHESPPYHVYALQPFRPGAPRR